MNEKGEYTRLTLTDTNQNYSLATYGGVVALTRKTIINDDLQAFTRIPAVLGVAAARKQSDVVWAIITGNQVMQVDNTAMFATAHNNLLTGANSALALGAGNPVTGIAAGRVEMRTQTGPQGTPLNLIPRYLLVPAALETLALQLIYPIQLAANQITGVVPEWIQGLVPIVEPRLDANEHDRLVHGRRSDADRHHRVLLPRRASGRVLRNSPGLRGGWHRDESAHGLRGCGDRLSRAAKERWALKRRGESNMKNYIQHGETVTVTAPYAVLSGGGLLVAGTGHIFGVAVNNQSSGDSTEVLTEGVFDLTKDTSTFAEGDYVYWDNSCKQCTSTATSNTKIGVAALTTPSGVNAPGGLSGDPTVRVRLNQSF